MNVEQLSSSAIDLLERLVAFDTTSRNSNLALLDFVDDYLERWNIGSMRIPNGDGTKSNLVATVGEPAEGGVILSGHTDVVPVDGQDWSSDPFALTMRDGRIFGRGTCDMKAFIALCLAGVPMFRHNRRPVHIALSYDEEVGCLGAPSMIARIAQEVPSPRCAIVGEPTGMKPMSRHKGISAYRVTVTGHEAHSSLTHLGLSANMVAIKLLHALDQLAEQFKAQADPGSPFSPPGATLTVGRIDGGTAINILARSCTFVFDLRAPAGLDVETALAGFFALAAQLDAEASAAFPGAGVTVEKLSDTPPLDAEQNGEAEQLVRQLTGYNLPAEAASYAAEGGQFQRAGFSTILFGPGSIEQAHKADEFIARDQIEQYAAFLLKLSGSLRD